MSSNSIGSTQWMPEVRCWCGEVAPVKMSWSNVNPGKRYRACPHYGGNRSCRFFEWIDSDVSERVSRVIRGLLKRLDNKDSEIQKLQTMIEKQNGVIKKMKWVNGKANWLNGKLLTGKANLLNGKLLTGKANWLNGKV
ncbi:PREDICTED: uncharacterized protein LOC109162640 [Ipomoea nil]|uniref:uncharacterized protein LOC109162640 n=1 Tax=Ipomoea nil TaxID=35883 RepID=UPI000901A307|nr:PREDICTED: uncharacterized protein LOC109162640 [Ipomoea nil]